MTRIITSEDNTVLQNETNKIYIISFISLRRKLFDILSQFFVLPHAHIMSNIVQCWQIFHINTTILPTHLINIAYMGYYSRYSRKNMMKNSFIYANKDTYIDDTHSCLIHGTSKKTSPQKRQTKLIIYTPPTLVHFNLLET